MILLDGKKTSEIIKAELAREVALMAKPPHLAAILVGNNAASEAYVNNKAKSCAQVGFKSSLFRYDVTITEKELLDKIEAINRDEDIDGLIVQLPLPDHISARKVTETISPAKDVDGFHPVNAGRLAQGQPSYIAATPKGILLLLEHYKIETTGKHCVIVGRSNIVGMPMNMLLLRNSYPGNCTVTVCHSKTINIKHHTSQADILIAALGKPGFITGDMIKENSVIIDVGITRVESSETKSGFKLAGDVDFDSVHSKCSHITPVPGGVGPMTIVGLLQNTLLAAKKEIKF